MRRAWAGITAGALLLLWPAFLNGYPLLFSDTGGFLGQVPLPDFNWDKPFVYGPLLLAFHGQTTLWLPAIAQAALVSAILFLTGRVVAGIGAKAHVLICLVLAFGSAAPWFASTLMPDIFAPLTVLCLFLLAYGPGRLSRPALAAVAIACTLSIAVHLAHLVLAAACIAVLCLARWRLLWRTALPLAAALALVVVMNAAGEREYGVSPYGQVFLLARLAADGPARTTLAERCPAAHWRLCAWAGRLNDDSDWFLWSADGPVWANGNGPTALRYEAGVLVRATILAHPVAVLDAMARNAAAELLQVRVGDTLGPIHLDSTVRKALAAWFPPEEQRRYDAALQPRGLLPGAAAPFLWPHLPLLVIGLAGTLFVAVRGPAVPRAFAVLVLTALLANAAGTGALSSVHDRYQARIAWLLLLPPLYAAARARRDTSAGVALTKAV